MNTATKRAEALAPTLNEHRLAGRPRTNPTPMELMMQTNIMPAPRAATVLCHREEAENYDRTLVHLGTGWRIIECKDALQFILQRKAAETVVGGRWRNFRYHRTRDTLYEAATRSGIDLTANQRAVIGALPRICGGVS